MSWAHHRLLVSAPGTAPAGLMVVRLADVRRLKRLMPSRQRIKCVGRYQMPSGGPCHLNHCSLQTVAIIGPWIAGRQQIRLRPALVAGLASYRSVPAQQGSPRTCILGEPFPRSKNALP